MSSDTEQKGQQTGQPVLVERGIYKYSKDFPKELGYGIPNHYHLCVKIDNTVALLYNRKYGRDGHLFKERFKSEPVRSSSARLLPTGRKNDMAYFTVLLRYIHQNPVKAGIVERVKDYEYSSWGEFDGTVEPVFQICDTRTVLN